MQNRKPVSLIYFGDSHGFIKGQQDLGGFANIATVVKQFREEHPNSLFFYGGDLLGPTEFTREFHGELDAKLLANMEVDAFAIGNHDLHNGPQGLRNIIDWTGIGTQFLAANLDTSREPLLKGKIFPSVIFEKDEQRIAVIGALTEEAKKSIKEHLGELQFTDLIPSIKEQIRAAKAKGADLIILLSHLGYEKDQAIAPALLEEGHDLVILGNHTHTSLGNLPENLFGKAKGAYPTEIAAHGRKAFITAASFNGQALGTLHVESAVNEYGQVIIHSCSGAPVVIDASIRPDAEAEKIIAAFPLKSDLVEDRVVGHTDVDLFGLEGFAYQKELEDIIRREETPLGNIVADRVHHHALEQVGNIDFALIHAGGIRSDIRAGDITEQQIKQLLPFPHFIVTLPLTGRQVKQALEEGVYTEDYKRRPYFLIGSADLAYTYDIEKPRDARVSDIKVAGQALDEDQVYQVAINSYMLGMKVTDTQLSVFASVAAENINRLAQTDCQAVLAYCEHHQLLISGRLHGRIQCAQGSLLSRYGSTATPEDLYIDVISKLSARGKEKQLEAAPSVQIPGTLFYPAATEPSEQLKPTASASPRPGAT